LFEEAVAAHKNKPVYSNMGTDLTFAELDELSRAFAAWLQKKSGLVAGDRVALMMPNILQYRSPYSACWGGGGGTCCRPCANWSKSLHFAAKCMR